MRLATDLNEKGQKAYRGTSHCLQQLYKGGGISAIYAGFPIAVGGVIVFRGLFLGGYDIGKSYIKDDVISRLLMAQFVTMFSGTVCYPLVRNFLFIYSNLEQPSDANSIFLF